MANLIALVTDSGTGCSETCLCQEHATEEAMANIEAVAAQDGHPEAPRPALGWHDVSESLYLTCSVCAAGGGLARPAA